VARKLEVEIVGDYNALSRAFRGAANDADGFGNHLQAAGGHLKTLAFAAAGAATVIGGGLALAIKASIQSANDHAKANAQTNAVIKSTGAAAHVTTQQVDALANAIEKKSGVDDLAVQTGSNMLLTFTGIHNEVGRGNDIFTQATKTVVDMSVALGQDTKNSAIQLGKALNDPLKGITALQRVGVSFTEDQKKQIAAMVKAGDTMGAQKLILHELNREFGGSADAMGRTLPGQINILKAHLDDLAQKIGQKLVPVITEAVTWITQHWPQISQIVGEVFNQIGQAWDSYGQPAFQALVQFGRFVVGEVRTHWTEIRSSVENAMHGIEAIITNVVAIAQAIWDRFGTAITTIVQRDFGAAVRVIKDVFAVIQATFQFFADLLHGHWAKAWDDLKTIVSRALDAAVTIVKTYVLNFITAAAAVGKAIIDGISRALSRLGDAVLDKFRELGAVIRGWAGTAYAYAFHIGSEIVHGVISGVGGLGAALKDKVEGTLKSTLSSLNPFSPVAHGGEIHIGRPLAEGTIEGWVLGTIPLPTKMADTIRKAVDAAKAAVDAARGTLGAAWSQLTSDADTAFSGLAAKLQTPTEKLIAAQEAARNMANLKDTLRQAQGALGDALKSGDQSQIQQAFKAEQDAEYQIQLVGEQKKAAQERVQLDARIALRQRHMDEALAQLQINLAKEGASHDVAQKKIVALLNGYGISYKTSGAALGQAFADGLAESYAAVSAAAQRIAEAAESKLKLHSPAKEGPLSKLDTWFKPFGKTLLGGLGVPGIEGGFSRVAAGFAGPAGGGGGGGDTFNFHFATPVGSPEAWVKDAAPAIARALRERKRLGGTTGY
jgi:hypothetical protein